MRPPPNQRGGMYSLSGDMETKAKLSTLARRLEELEMRNQHEVRAMTKASMPNQPCFNCQSTEHQGEHCPSVPSVRDFMAEQSNAVANTSHQPHPHTAIPTTPTRGTTQTSPGNQNLLHMCLLLHNSSMDPQPSHSHHHLHLQLNKLL